MHANTSVYHSAALLNYITRIIIDNEISNRFYTTNPVINYY